MAFAISVCTTDSRAKPTTSAHCPRSIVEMCIRDSYEAIRDGRFAAMIEAAQGAGIDAISGATIRCV